MDERRMPLALVHRENSHDTIQALETLLTSAKNGELIGFAYAAMYIKPIRGYTTDAAGEAYANPTFASGMAMALTKYLLNLLDRGHKCC